MKTVVFILPAAYQAAGDALAQSFGWGEDVYVVSLSPTGELPATHYGCSTQVSDYFLSLFSNPPPEAAPVIAALHSNFSDYLGGEQLFNDSLSELGLKQIL